MRIKYFSTVYGDLKGSPGWVRKMFFLALVMFIPVFGSMVVNSYLYGWARNAAYGIWTPLPKRVFGNEDGQLYKRAGRLFVVQLVYQAIPILLMIIAYIFVFPWGFYYDAIISTSLGASSEITSDVLMQDMAVRVVIVLVLVSLAALLSVVLGFFCWAGSVRSAIYESIGAGLQFGKVFAMLKKDFLGILKIYGMSLIILWVIGMIVSIIITILMMLFSVIAVGVIAEYVQTIEASGRSRVDIGDLIVFFLGIIVFVSIITPIIAYFEYVCMMFSNTMVTRALGYWARSSMPELGWQPGMVAPGIWPAVPGSGPGAPGQSAPGQSAPAPAVPGPGPGVPGPGAPDSGSWPGAPGPGAPNV